MKGGSCLEISFSNRKLEKILTNERLIKREYSSLYRNIINRLSELKVANNLSEIPHVPPPRRHKLEGEYLGCWGIDISKNYRMIIKPTEEFSVEELRLITDITILEIGDYH